MNDSAINDTNGDMLQGTRGTMPTQETGTILGYIFYPILWATLLMMSVFVIYNIIDYLKSKPPNVQTLLDKFYIHLFWVWIVQKTFIAIYVTMVEIELGTKIWGVAMVAGSLYYGIAILNAIYQLESCVCRMIMIFKPHIKEHFNEEKILKYTRLVFTFRSFDNHLLLGKSILISAGLTLS